MIKVLLMTFLCACGAGYVGVPNDTPGGPIGKPAPPHRHPPNSYGYLVRIQDQSVPFVYAYLFGCGDIPYNVTIPQGGGDDLLVPTCATAFAIGSVPPVPPTAVETCYLHFTQGKVSVSNPSQATHCRYKEGVLTY